MWEKDPATCPLIPIAEQSDQQSEVYKKKGIQTLQVSI